MMIKNLDDDSMSLCPVLLRPGRLGKEPLVQVLECYYDISYQDRSDGLFCGTGIYDDNLPAHNSLHVTDFDFSSVTAGDKVQVISGI